jgi:predicted dehydrogenase
MYRCKNYLPWTGFRPVHRYRAAVIGLGRMGSTVDDEWGYGPHAHAACWRTVDGVDLVAGADWFEERRPAFEERYPGTHTYADPDEMLYSEKPDIVSVTTHTDGRHGAILACVRAGVQAVFAEKPLAASLGEAREIVQACKEAGTVLAVNASRSWQTPYAQALRLVESGQIGELRCIVAFCKGNLSHMGSHIIDTVHRFAGRADAQWVMAQCPAEAAVGASDLPGAGMIQLANGVRAYVNMLDAAAVGVSVELVGTAGRIRGSDVPTEWELWRHVPGEGGRSALARFPFPLPLHAEPPNLAAVRDILRALETGSEPAVTGRHAGQALEIALAFRESERTGRRVNLPLTDSSLRLDVSDLRSRTKG